jgi:RNA polymerase primary sigma factor
MQDGGVLASLPTDVQGRHARIVANLGFVVKVAKEYRNFGLSFDDLIGEGHMGLIEAAERFDECKGVKFITYAIWWIRKSMLTALSRQITVVQIPDYRRRLARTQGLRHREISLSEPVGHETERTVADSLPAPGLPSLDELIQRETEVQLGEALGELDERARTVIRCRYGLAGGTGLTLRETGQELGISRERVRQIEEAAMRRLRRILARRLSRGPAPAARSARGSGPRPREAAAPARA